MSLRHLLVAVKDQLVSSITDCHDPRTCRITDRSGQPPAYTGQVFYSIHPLDWFGGPSQGTQNIGSDELYSVGVTISLKTGRTAPDRLMEQEYLAQTTGLDDRLREVIKVMTQNRYTGILARANANITNHPIVEPLQWERCDPEPEIVGPDWFTSDPNSRRPDSGWKQTAYFGGARRLQNINTME